MAIMQSRTRALLVITALLAAAAIGLVVHAVMQ